MGNHSAEDICNLSGCFGKTVKVLFLNHETELGGAELMLFEFLRSCDREKYSCELVIPTEGPLGEEVMKAGVKLHVLHIEPELLTVRRKSPSFSLSRVLALRRGVKELRSFIRSQSPDVVVSNSVKSHV